MKIVTADQMRRIDARAEREHGIPSEKLMDNAGRAVAEGLMGLYPGLASMNLLIVCGKGNNGGDGLAVARHLKSRGVPARAVLLCGGADLKGPAAVHLKLATQDGARIEEAADERAWTRVASELGRHAVILDAMLGTGLTGPARGLTARAIQDLNAAQADVVALDIPSGLSGDHPEIPGAAVRARHTIALACPKVSHLFPPAEALVGDLRVADIGMPEKAVLDEGADLNLVDEADVAPLVPVRESDSHKGDYGRLLVVAGSLGKSGAAAMLCHAALRSGAGLVTAATAASAQPILAAQVAEMMTVALPQTLSGAVSLAAAPLLRALMLECDVLAVGPGLSTEPETVSLVREILSGASMPIVLDADGLNAYAGRADDLEGESRVMILTPHPGEMARLLDGPQGGMTAKQVQADRVGIARSFARERSCYVILKGHHTLIAEPAGQVYVNPTGNPGMATGGSGDVLTGVLAGLLAQGLSPLQTALLGVYVHGLAGDLAAADLGETSLIARDLIDYLSEAFLRLERSAP